MYRRKDVRYSVLRCRQDGEHPARWQEIYDWVLDSKPDELDVWDFAKTWDVLITRNKEIMYVEPERDISFIQTTCSEAKILTKHQMNFDGLSDRQNNIVSIVENAMLDGKMSWENYAEAWRVELDTDTGQIDTRLNVQAGQTVVTPTMIVNSQRVVDPAELSQESKQRIKEHADGVSYDQTLDLTGDNSWQTMTPEEIEAIKQIAGKKD